MKATVSWITNDEASVKAAFNTLMVKYANDKAAVLAIMNNNEIATTNADDWAIELKQDVEVMQPWVPDQAVLLGELRSYNGQRYVVVQSHTTQLGWEPNLVPALFTLKPVPSSGQLYPDWIQPTGAQDAYALTDRVHHLNEDWEARRGVNTWEPGTNNGGWIRISNLPAPWYYLGSEGYPLNWEVTHNGSTWRNNQANNFWEPGVFGWVII